MVNPHTLHHHTLGLNSYRWRAFDEHLGRGTAIERHLPALSPRQTIMLMDNLPRLRQEALQTKIALMKKVGGHPKSIELLEGWLAAGRVTDLLNDPGLDGLLAEQWEEYFLRALLAQLTPTQREGLARLSVFRTLLDKQEFTYAGVDAATLHRWLDLSLLERAGPDLYSIHEVVRQYLLGQMAPAERRAWHAWAGAYYGRVFVEMVREGAAQSGLDLTEEDITGAARSVVVDLAVHQTHNLDGARKAMAEALEWYHHLFAAEVYKAAGNLVDSVWDILDRWGQRDRAKVLLRESIATLDGSDKAAAQSNLASMLIDERQFDEALAISEEAYLIFEELDAREQMASILGQSSRIYQLKGEIDQSIAKRIASFRLREQIGDQQGQAISLDHLSVLYVLNEDYTTALGYSEAAERLARTLRDDDILAFSLYHQGIIHNHLIHTAQSDEERLTQTQTALKRFKSSYDLWRRIGDEKNAADALFELGKILGDAGYMQEAIAAFTKSLATYGRLGIPTIGNCLEGLGVIHVLQGEYEAALEKFQQALAVKRQYNSPQEQAITERLIARVQARLRGAG